MQFTYQKTDTKNPSTASDLSSFTQRYDLGYQGYADDPRLFLYDVGGSFMKQDSELDQSTAGTATSTAETRDYHAKLDFIQGTRFPFSIFTEKDDTPVWTVQPGQSFLTKQTVDRYGLLGNALLGAGTSLSYNFFQDDTKTESPTQQTDQLNKGLSLNVSSTRGDAYFNAGYAYQQDLEKVADRYSQINDARAAFGLKPSTNTRFNMDTSYHDDSYYEFSDTGTTMNLLYTPSSDFNSNLRVYGDRITQQEETGTFTSLVEDASYRISPFLTSTGNVTLSKNQGAFENDATEALTLGLAFTKPLPNNVTLSASTSANGTLQQFENAPDRNAAFYSFGADVAKNFPAINTQVSGGGSCYVYSSSLGGRDTRYGYHASLISRVIQNLTFQSLLNFTRENALSDAVSVLSIVTPTVPPGQPAPADTVSEHLVSDNSLEYSVPLGIRGNLDAKTGAIFESGTTPRTFYYDNLTLLYAPKSNLSLNAGLNYYRDSINQTRTLSASLGANYLYRSLIMTLKNDWWQQSGPLGISRNMNVLAQVSRPF